MKKRTGKQPLKRALIYYHSFLEYVNGSIANRFKEKREKQIERKWHVINEVLDNIAKESPTKAELGTVANWSLKYNAKNVKMGLIKSVLSSTPTA